MLRKHIVGHCVIKEAASISLMDETWRSKWIKQPYELSFFTNKQIFQHPEARPYHMEGEILGWSHYSTDTVKKKAHTFSLEMDEVEANY